MRKVLLASVAASAVICGTAHAQQISGDVVKIGVLSDLSGVYSDFGGPGAVEAARMAVADFGGKVLGKTIEVISADHQNKADVAASKAREVVRHPGRRPHHRIPQLVGRHRGLEGRDREEEGPDRDRRGHGRLSNEDCAPYTIHYVYDTYSLAQGTGAAVVVAATLGSSSRRTTPSATASRRIRATS